MVKGGWQKWQKLNHQRAMQPNETSQALSGPCPWPGIQKRTKSQNIQCPLSNLCLWAMLSYFQFIHPSCAGGCCRQSWEKTDVTCYHPPSRVRTTSCSTSRTKLVAKKTTNKGKKFKWKSWMGSSVFLIVCCCVVLMRYQWCWKWQLLGVIGLACSNNIFRVHDN